jgi:UPF0176 protein
MYDVAALYHFITLHNIPALRADITAAGQAAPACGTLLLAPEGINGTLAGKDPAFQSFVNTLITQFHIPAENVKWSTATTQPFKRLKIRTKKEIITMKRDGVDVAARTGAYIAPKDWNKIITQDDVLVVDTRNTYETERGTFTGAVDPRVTHFSEFADYIDNLDPAKTPAVAMFCTGGIRCEKASSYMLNRGFKTVYQLQGGILKYLETVPKDQSLWQGDCFVFDNRVALGHGLVEAE